MLLISASIIIAVLCLFFLLKKVEKYSYVPKVNVITVEEPEVNMDIVSPIDQPHSAPIIKRVIQTRQHIQSS